MIIIPVRRRLVESFGLSNRVLSHCPIKHNDRVARCCFIEFANNAVNLCQFIHQFRTICRRPAVSMIRISVPFLCLFHRAVRHRRCITACLASDDRGICAKAPAVIVQLRRTKCITSTLASLTCHHLGICVPTCRRLLFCQSR